MSSVAFSPASHPPLWLRGKNYDLIWFHLSALVCLFLIFPSWILGASATVPIYNFYLLFFGIPHNFLTWSTFLSQEVQEDYQMGTIQVAAAICLVLCGVMYVAPGTDLESWVLSLITYASLWHAYRQHHGICKVYDAVQAKRDRNGEIFEDRKVLNLGFGLTLFSVLVWIFTYPRVEFLLSADAMYDLVYPQVPLHLFQWYTGISLAIFCYGLKKATWDRSQRGLPIPWPQISLMFLALATYILPFAFLPIEALPVGVAIATMYHNIQYFGFVWLFEEKRAELRLESNLSLSKMGSWALKKQWVAFFGVALAYSFVIVGIYGIWPTRLLLVTIYFLAFAHYVIDGYIWTSQCNKNLGGFIQRLTQA